MMNAATIPPSESIQSNNSSTKIYIIVGAVVVALVIGFILLCFYKRKKQQRVAADHGHGHGYESRNVHVPKPKKSNKTRTKTKESLMEGGDSLMVDIRKSPQIPYTAVSSTGSTTPTQIPQAPPQTPLNPQPESNELSTNIRRISSGGLSGRGSRSHSEQRDTPLSQSRSSSDKSQRASLDFSALRSSTQEQSYDPTRTPEHRSSMYGSSSSLQYSNPDISHPQFLGQPPQPFLETQHDVYPEGPSAPIESYLEQASASGTRDASPYREYETHQTFGTPIERLQTQTRSEMFDSNPQSSQHSFDDESGEPYRRPISPFPQTYNDPSIPNTPSRGRPSSYYAPETDNPGSPSPPQQHPLQRSIGGSRRARPRGSGNR